MRRLRQDASRKNGVKYSHTTHKLGPCRIAYRFHPFFDREVRVIRRLRAQETPTVIVEIVDDDFRFALPCWMLDSLICDSFTLETEPRLPVEALISLRNFLDTQIEAFSSPKDDSTVQSNAQINEQIKTPLRKRGPASTDL